MVLSFLDASVKHMEFNSVMCDKARCPQQGSCDRNLPWYSNTAAAALWFALPTAPTTSAEVMRRGTLVLSAASCWVTTFNCSLTHSVACLKTVCRSCCVLTVIYRLVPLMQLGLKCCCLQLCNSYQRRTGISLQQTKQWDTRTSGCFVLVERHD